MAERLRGREHSEFLREQLIEKLNELALPLVTWNAESNAADRAQLTSSIKALSNEDLLNMAEAEGVQRDALVEIMGRLQTGTMSPEQFLEDEDWDPDTSRCMKIAWMALKKLDAALTAKKEASDIETTLEEYARKGLITQSDIDFGKSASDELKELKALADITGRIDWQPSIMPPAIFDEDRPTSRLPEDPNSSGSGVVPAMNRAEGQSADNSAKVNRQVTVRPPGQENEPVNERGPTVAVPFAPPAFPSPSPYQGIIGDEPTVAMPRMHHAVVVPRVADPLEAETLRPGPNQRQQEAAVSFVQAKKKRGTDSAELITSYEALAENPDIVSRPMAILCDALGNPVADPIPLFSNLLREDGANIHTIGTDVRCDVRLDPGEHPYIYPFHADIKIEGRNVFIRCHEGAASVWETGSIFAKEWTEAEPGKVIHLIPHFRNGMSPHSVRSRIHLRVEPQHQMLQDEFKNIGGAFIIERSKELLEQARKIFREKKENFQKELLDTVFPYLVEAFEFDGKNLKSLPPELRREMMDFMEMCGPTVERLIVVTKESIEKLHILHEARQQVESMERQEEQRKLDRIAARASRERVAALHLGENEDPEKMTVFRYPVYYLRPYLGEAADCKPIPMIVPRVVFGTNEVCHQKLSPSDKTDKSKHQVADFMAKLFCEEENGEIVFSVKYLHNNVRVRAEAGAASPPPRETFPVPPGTRVELGHYTLSVDPQRHGFSYEMIKDYLRHMVDKLIQRIENQDVTTSRQDEEAHKFLCGLLKDIRKSDLEQSIKDETIEYCRSRYEKIFHDLWNKICAWDEGNPAKDSGFFQTVLMLVRTSKQTEIFRDEYGVTLDKVAAAALSRVAMYCRAAKDGEKEIGRVSTLMAKISSGRDQKVKEEKEKNKAIARNGIVEIARFIEFGLVKVRRLSAMGAPHSYIDQIRRVLEIREHFQKLDGEESGKLDEILRLFKLSEGKRMEEIFAPEEIHTRNLHIEIDMKANDAVQKYVQKIAVFAARKAFKRMDTSREPEDVMEDAALIRGLADAKIINLLQLIDAATGEYKTYEEVEDVLLQKKREATTERQAHLQADLARQLEEEEIGRLVEQAAAVHSALVRSRKGINYGTFVDMLSIAPVALNTHLQKLMARRDYDIYIDSKECVVRTDISKAGATETRINWKRYFKEWEQRFRQISSIFAKKVTTGDKNASEIKKLLDQGAEARLFTYDELGVTKHELERGVILSLYRHQALMKLESFDYLEFEPADAADNDFWNGIKGSITRAKLERMFDEWKKAENDRALRLRMERKIRVLQKKDPRAIDWFSELHPTDEERALLQLSK